MARRSTGRATATRCSSAMAPWHPNRSTTRPGGTKSPTSLSSWWDPTAFRSQRCECRMTGKVRVDVHLEPGDMARALEADVRAGFASTPKTLPPKWFYDDRGSELFDAITRLPEYYPTRTERAILSAHAREVAELTKAGTLVEL